MQNNLKNETSPYLLQHAENPVHWYPWCEEAFRRAKEEDKPVFLSIGYSTCHWCHVMAHESFEDEEIATILNENFISIKVDKEERPDIDSIYMAVCQALTGSGGWPTSIFMTSEQKPFFAGTYIPKNARYGTIGFLNLITAISEKWKTDRAELLESAEEIVAFISKEKTAQKNSYRHEKTKNDKNIQGNKFDNLIESALKLYRISYDKENGGFGSSPKFPASHNLLFLLNYYERTQEKLVMEMVEKTLLQMYRGGIFDHIGGGFCRYSTDSYFLVPHFEKMLYDNAWLMMTYAKAYELTNNVLYKGVAKKIADYILGEMTSPRGGFYSAQDADSEGVEGKYYLFEPIEIKKVLGVKEGERFCKYFDITEEGNFEGKSIPNLLKSGHITAEYNSYLPALYEYRRKRYHLHLDDKILTSWNGLMIAAMCQLYRITKEELYLGVAEQAQAFIENKLCEGDTLFVSWREGQCSGKGFLDDYANEIFALLSLYDATLETQYLERAAVLCDKTVANFHDETKGGFFLNGREDDALIIRPKETYDGAMPSGNSMMAYNLVRLSYLLEEQKYKDLAEEQILFMMQESKLYPAGFAQFLSALLDYMEMPEKVTVVVKEKKDIKNLPLKVGLNTLMIVKESPTKEYPLKNEKTTYYVCKGKSCQPPRNELEE